MMYETIAAYDCPDCGVSKIAVHGSDGDLTAECHGCGRTPKDHTLESALKSAGHLHAE